MIVRVRTVWLIAGAAVTLLTLLFAGRLFAAEALPDQTDQNDRTYTQAVTRVEIDSNAGDATLTPGPAGEVKVHKQSTWSAGSKPQIEESWSGTTLHFKVRCPEGRGSGECSVDFELSVPPEVSTDLRTEAGILTVTDLTGPTRLATSAGDVFVEGARGDVLVRTDKGDVTGTGLRSAKVDIEVQNGDTDLAFASVPKTVKSVTQAGDVQLVVPKGAYAVQASAQSDDVNLGFESDPAATSTITATVQAGRVDIRHGG
jgi:hypothetical protein